MRCRNKAMRRAEFTAGNWTPTNVAWAAGFFDGEGSFAAHRTGTIKPQPYLMIANSDLDSIERYASIFPGVINPYQPPNPSWKRMYKVGVSGFERVQAIVATMWPWLSRRRKERWKEIARLVLAYQPRPKGKSFVVGHESYTRKLTEEDEIVAAYLYRRTELTQRDLAAYFSVDHGTMSRAIRRVTAEV